MFVLVVYVCFFFNLVDGLGVERNFNFVNFDLIEFVFFVEIILFEIIFLLKLIRFGVLVGILCLFGLVEFII